MMHSTLLVGPADWDPVRLPREEFAARLHALWQADPLADGAVVYGDSRHHAELAYLTHFTPKLEAGLGLIARTGEARLLVGGGVNMLPAAKPLTWLDDILVLRDGAASMAEWVRDQALRSLLVIGGGAMPQDLHGAIMRLPGVTCVDATALLRGLMRRKTARELALARTACTTLAAAAAALAEAQRAGAGVTAAILAAEQAAWGQGAQDVRTLFSLDHGRTFRPFGVPIEAPANPLAAYLAVRRHGYWAEGFVTRAREADPALRRARAGLQAGLSAARPGVTRRAVADAIAHAVGAPHPIARPSVASIGLGLDDCGDAADVLDAGEVLSLRAGVLDQGGAAVASAVIAVHDHGNEVLWQQGA